MDDVTRHKLHRVLGLPPGFVSTDEELLESVARHQGRSIELDQRRAELVDGLGLEDIENQPWTWDQLFQVLATLRGQS